MSTSTTLQEIPLKSYKGSEIDIRALGSTGLNFAAANTSSQRHHMDASHLKQHLALVDGDPKRWFTGIEREYAKQGFLIKFPTDCIRVIDVISKYTGILPRDMESPLTLIIYERRDDHRIDVLELPSIRFEHQTFGFNYQKTKEGRGIMKHKAFRKGTILATPPTITEDMDYKYGKELNVLLANDSAGIDDGAWISDEGAYMLRTEAFGELEMSLDRNHIPLNLYGDDNTFKPIPDIGDYLRDDGLVMGWRDFYQKFPMALYNRKALRRASVLDNTRYGEQYPGAGKLVGFELPPEQEILLRPRVVDIEVIKGGSNKAPITKSEEQFNRYWERTVRFYEQIRKCHEDLERVVPGYELAPAWQRYVDSSYFYTNQPTGTRQESFKRKTIPNWYVKIKFRYTFVPTIGAKISNIHAGKTVIVKKTPASEMPLDADGNRAHLVVEDISLVNRMNSGVAAEMMLGACELATRKRIREMVEANVNLDEIYDYYTGFMKIVSPTSYQDVLNPIIDRKREIEEICRTGIYAKVPPSLAAHMVEILEELMDKYPPCIGPIELTTPLGRKVKTREPAMIGVMHILLLERWGQHAAAVNSARRQHHGIPTKASKTDRHSFPVKISSTRFPSEADTKSIQSHLNNEGIPELIDRSLNPVSHRIICRTLARTENPAQIEDAVPRDKFPRQGNRVIAIRDNMLLVGGIKLVEGKDGNAVLPTDEGY